MIFFYHWSKQIMSDVSLNVIRAMSLIVNGDDGGSVDDKVMDVFDDISAFTEAVNELLTPPVDMHNLYNFIKLCISVDVIVNARYNFSYAPEDDLEILVDSGINKIVNVLDGCTVDNSILYADYSDMAFVGLTGIFVSVYDDRLMDKEAIFNFTKLLMDATLNNPHTAKVWWVDSLKDIHGSDVIVEDMDNELWVDCESDLLSNRDVVERWYLKLSRILVNLIDLRVDIDDTHSPASIMYHLFSELAEETRELSNAEIGSVSQLLRHGGGTMRGLSIESVVIELFTVLSQD